MVYGALLLALGFTWFLYRTRAGLVLRAVGESPSRRTHWAIRCGASGLAGGGRRAVWSAGAYLSVIYTPLWVEGMVAGKGWIALALTTFATWRPARAARGLSLAA